MEQDIFKKISTLVFDIDGVLTDGMVLVLENGLQARRMNIKDGYSLQLAVKKGYRLLVMSGAALSPVIDRLNKLGIREVHMGVEDKRKFLLQYMAAHKLDASEVLYMGDDMPDLDALSIVGLASCPSDAVTEVKAVCHYVSPLPGGHGCARDVIEKVLKSRNHWHHIGDIASK